mmetsp:Transcript_186/g.458  ORF Transcript_186/g.458 Transcript_186/m.458 type:complete len:252 (-) Transcript_186:206-961(-)
MPLAPVGLFALMLPTIAARFSCKSSASKDVLPKERCTMPPLSALYSTVPALSALTASSTLGDTVPAFGLGMRPLGPKTLPSLATFGIMSGVATSLSKSSMPPAISSMRSSPPTYSAPAALAAASWPPPQSTAILTSFPVPLGRATVALSCWSLYLGLMFRRMWASTASLNLVVAFSFTSLSASSELHSAVLSAYPLEAKFALACLNLLDPSVATDASSTAAALGTTHRGPLTLKHAALCLPTTTLVVVGQL